MLDTGFVKGIVEGGTAALDVITALVDKLGAVPTLMGLITGAFTAYQIGSHGTNQLFDFERLDDGRIKMSLFNQELSDIQTRFAQARASGEGFFSSLYKGVKDPFAKYGESIRHYNDALKDSSVDMDKYIDNLDSAGGALNRYLRSLNGQKASLSGFRSFCQQSGIALKQMSIGANAASVAVKGLGVALNVVASVGIGLLISALTTLVVKLATAGETLRENTLNASQEYKDTATSLSAYQSEIDGLNSSLA